MKLVSLFVLPLLATLAPAAGAQRLVDVAQRCAAEIQAETRTGFAELDAAFATAERRLLALLERDVPELALREHVQETRATFGEITGTCTRSARSMETDALQILLRLGADRRLLQGFQVFTTREMDLLERHEAQLTHRLVLLVKRLK
jgi:hypothetical protein